MYARSLQRLYRRQRNLAGYTGGPRQVHPGSIRLRRQATGPGSEVSVTQLAPDVPAPRLELVHYHVGTRRPIPRDTASNDIAATHTVVWVASLDATAAALTRHGRPLASDDLMIVRGGIRAALVAGPDGHRFLAEKRAAATCAASDQAQPCEPNA